ncbi:syntaxin 16 [Cryptococcus bacillisporus CA1873]|uniref:Syntaxin 16 n=1 Tax=Cryptococcus bacillisporus CA1873 TaxID=1296111 RepID=A0ABR5B8C6_CRYGA|nr:syntaxin 16 [Cryptococcus bacillisporus CA1873]|eukprot:KIR59465.1 syntaxin 16 [Cryptococcus gattii CA1873]
MSNYNPLLPNADEPITRSRTLFFLSIRDSNPFSRARPSREYGHQISLDDGGGDEGEEDRLIGGRGGWKDIGMKGLPPKWVDLSEEVEEILGRTRNKIAALDKLHTKHVLPGFTDRSSEEREIERQTIDITRDFKRCTSLIGSITPERGAPRVQVLTAKNVQRGLAQKVQEMSGQFRKKQKVYMSKLQGHQIKNKDLMVASGAITLKGTEVLDELQEDEQASQNQLSQTHQAQSAVNIDINQRSREIKQIASSISELAELFRDLGQMVVEQGTVLDSVEWNVMEAAKEVKGGEEELVVARRYQANTARRKCIFFLLLCIFALILILIYKPRSHPSPSSPAFSSSLLSSNPTATSSSWAKSTARVRPSHTKGSGKGGNEGIVLPSSTGSTEKGKGRPALPRPPPLASATGRHGSS